MIFSFSSDDKIMDWLYFLYINDFLKDEDLFSKLNIKFYVLGKKLNRIILSIEKEIINNNHPALII